MGNLESGKQPEAAHGLKPDELEYRMMLQEAILWATKQIMQEQEAEIKKRAAARVQTLLELRG